MINDQPKTLREIADEAKRGAIKIALFFAGGNLATAARGLGRNRTEFYREIKRLGIDLPAFRAAFGTPRGRGPKARAELPREQTL